MFRKLRNKLILINLGITTLVIVLVFSLIYIVETQAAKQRPPMPGEQIEIYTDDFENALEIYMERERQAAAQDLLIMLIISGIAIELFVVVISYYMAETAIAPIRDAYNAQKLFIANASHEIKTPLAAISANLEAADIKDNKWIRNVEKETAKLTALNGELLTLARTDLMENSTLSEVDLNEVIIEELKSFEPRLDGIKLKLDIKPVRTKTNSSDFVQIFRILVDNAIKYCNHKINISLNDHMLEVVNDGTTISENDLPHIFERFYQTDKTAEGVGLGLSIAKTTADKNGWELFAESDQKSTSLILNF